MQVINVERMKILLGKTAKEMENSSYLSKWLETAKEISHKELSSMENIEQILRTIDECEHQVCKMSLNSITGTAGLNMKFTNISLLHIVEFPKTERKANKLSC